MIVLLNAAIISSQVIVLNYETLTQAGWLMVVGGFLP